MKQNIVTAFSVAILIVVGLSTALDRPVVTYDQRFYPLDYHGNEDEYEEDSTCRGIPILYESCKTYMVKRSPNLPPANRFVPSTPGT